MADIHAPRASLPGLPPELQELVAAEVPPEDLLALRSTCKEVRDGTDLAFCRAHFTEKTFMLNSSESMQALVDISEHPRFGKTISKLNFCALQLLPPDYSFRRRSARETGTPRRGERAEIRARHRLQQELHKRHKAFYLEHEWRPPLESALRILKQSRGSVSIAFLDPWEPVYTACGRKRIERLTGYRACFGPAGFADDRKIIAFMRSLSEAACPIEEFDPRGLLRLDIAWTMLEGADFLDDLTVFTHLRRLDVHLDAHLAENREPVKRFLRFLARAPALEHLALTVPTDQERFFQFFSELAHLPKIRELQFREWVPNMQDLGVFCRKHEETLKQVRFDDGFHALSVTAKDAAEGVQELSRTLPGIAFATVDSRRKAMMTDIISSPGA